MLNQGEYNWVAVGISFVLFITLMLSLIRGVFTDLRHPGIAFLTAWIAVFILLAAPLIKYSNLTYFGMIFIFVSILTIYLSSVISSLSRTLYFPKSEINISIIRILAWVSFSVALYYQQTRFGIVNLILNPGLVRSSDDGGTGFLGILVYSPMICWTLLLINFFWLKSRKLKSNLVIQDWVFILFCFLYMLILPERTTLLNTLTWTAFSAWMTLPKPQIPSFKLLTRVFLPISLMVLFSLGFFVSVSERTGKVNAVGNIRYALNPTIRIDDSFVDPYLYLTGSVPAVNGIITHALDKEPLLGLVPERTALFIRRTLQVFTGSNDSLTANAEYANIPFPFNTYSMFYDPIMDFHLIGSILYCIVCGSLIGFIYSSAIKNNNVFMCFIYGWGASGLVFGIMTNKFSGIYYTFSLILVVFLVAISRLSKRRSIKRGMVWQKS